MTKNILIASGSRDIINFEKVSQIIKTKGYKVTVFQPDSIATRSIPFTANFSRGELVMSYDDQPFDPASFSAAWYRKPSFYSMASQSLRWLSLKEEYFALQRAIWELMPANIWLNEPYAMVRASRKLPQLVVAAKLGFDVPDTTITNSWDAIESQEFDTFAVKMHESLMLPTEDGHKIMTTNIVKRSSLPKQASPYPGIWQQYIPKKKEWRVTVIGDQVFAGAIYTDGKAKDDWRKHQYTSSVRFEAEIFPADLQQKCKALLKHYGLRFGAFDFIETPDGRIIFLEVNPNGQFMWLEEKLDLHISQAIADELMRIAEDS